MQASYPNKFPPTHWDTLYVEHPVHQYLQTGTSSEATARKWREQPEVIKQIVFRQFYKTLDVNQEKARASDALDVAKGAILSNVRTACEEETNYYFHNNFKTLFRDKNIRQPCFEEGEYDRDYNITKDLTRSQSAVDHGYKIAERFRFNKHTPWSENHYIYPPSRKLAGRVPAASARERSETSSEYQAPAMSARLATDKDQYKHPAFLPLAPPKEITYHKELEPLDTTYEGFEKFLDPYLTTSRLHHRPYTAHELTTASNSKDIMTYYTYADIPWVRVPRPKVNEWGLPISRPKSMYDREKFKEDFKEIRTHNKLGWVPGSFRTETRDNYVQQTSRPESQIHSQEEAVRTHYQRCAAQLVTNILQEDTTTRRSYSTENSMIGSRKPTCTILDPFVEKNKRLVRKSC